MNLVQKIVQFLLLTALAAGSIFIAWMIGTNANGSIGFLALSAVFGVVGVFLAVGAVMSTRGAPV